MSAPVPHPCGTVASLHVHASTPGQALCAVENFNLVAGKGVLEDSRYFGRINSDTGKPNPRQVTLIEREQMAEHAATLGLPGLPAGAVRANIETTRINLPSLVGWEVEIGETLLRIYAPRTPCAKMDAVCSGLRQLMLNHRQGVLAEVVRSGVIRVGDPVRPLRANVTSQ